MSGPLLGNARAGFMAERFGLARSITWGGLAVRRGRGRVRPALARVLASSEVGRADA